MKGVVGFGRAGLVNKGQLWSNGRGDRGEDRMKLPRCPVGIGTGGEGIGSGKRRRENRGGGERSCEGFLGFVE